jgi:hypothetical protein
VIEPTGKTGKTTRLVDWAIGQARKGERVVFLCAFAEEVPHVTALLARTAFTRGILGRERKHSVELLGEGRIDVILSDNMTRMRANAKVAVDDWWAHQAFIRMYMMSWSDDWVTEG